MKIKVIAFASDDDGTLAHLGLTPSLRPAGLTPVVFRLLQSSKNAVAELLVAAELSSEDYIVVVPDYALFQGTRKTLEARLAAIPQDKVLLGTTRCPVRAYSTANKLYPELSHRTIPECLMARRTTLMELLGPVDNELDGRVDEKRLYAYLKLKTGRVAVDTNREAFLRIDQEGIYARNEKEGRRVILPPNSQVAAEFVVPERDKNYSDIKAWLRIK